MTNKNCSEIPISPGALASRGNNFVTKWASRLRSLTQSAFRHLTAPAQEAGGEIQRKLFRLKRILISTQLGFLGTKKEIAMDHYRTVLPTLKSRFVAAATSLLLAFSTMHAAAAEKIWDGGGGFDNAWQTGANWDGNTAPSPGDSLVFTGSYPQITNFNDFPEGTQFNGLGFRSPAGPFVLLGNSITLAGNIFNTQTGLVEIVGMSLVLSNTPEIFVDNRATLGIRGGMSGTGAGMFKSGLGNLSLSGVNTYDGGTVINDGTVTLDFPQAPFFVASNILTGSLSIGGVNSENLATNFASLVVNGRVGGFNVQLLDATDITPGISIIRTVPGSGGGVILGVGSLTHSPGGTMNVVASTSNVLFSSVNTVATNVNGLLGGWATVGGGAVQFGLIPSTNFAHVDATGNIVAYTNYVVFSNGMTIASHVPPQANLLITTGSTGDVRVDADHAFSVTDVNTINVRRWTTGIAPMSIIIGSNNTLRLGRYGGIFKSDTATGIPPNWTIGQSTNGVSGVQNIGVLTAGGEPDADGEIVLHVNSGSQTAGFLSVDAQIADNGLGSVAVVKAGPGGMKLRGHNTFSGGFYGLMGRILIAGAEIGTPNPDGAGTGPIVIFPGCYLFPSGIFTGTITNALFIAGNGTAQEPLGAIRPSAGTLSGPIMLIGDATIAGGTISGQISGPYNLSLCPQMVINATLTLSNPSNNWTGTTFIQARNNINANLLVNGASEVIPNGPGKGDVVMRTFSAGRINWNLNGQDETINGFSSIGSFTNASSLTNAAVFNGAPSTVSTLIIGDNDASGAFTGTVRDNLGTGGVMRITKIGAGTQTLTGENPYTGRTLVAGGTLAVVAPTSSVSSAEIVLANGGILDVTGIAGGGTLVRSGSQSLSGDGAVAGSVLSLFNATIAPGTIGTVGLLTVSGQLHIGGTTYMDIDKTAAMNDQLTAGNNLNYDGTLNLTTISGTLADGDSFKLFDAATYSGAFTTIEPATPGPQLAWDTSGLTVDGTIRVVLVNQPPVANSQEVSVAEDNSVGIVLTGTDPDENPLTFSVVTFPSHGTLTGTAPNLTYAPDTNYFGPDSFTFKVNDGHVDSSSATVSITVSPVNDAPIAPDQSATVDEDVPGAINLLASDVDDGALTYTLVSLPAHGTLSGTAPALTYTPATNYHGPDSFTYQAADGVSTSGIAEVSITVNPVNDAPVADASATVPVVISANNSNATVTLNGTLSSDIDGDTLQFTWFRSGTAIATGATATAVLPVGVNVITLVVDDGAASSSNSVTVTVLTTAQSVEQLRDLVEGSVENNSLIATLRAALNSIDRSNPATAINQLQAFQSQVQNQIAPLDPELAATFIADAQEIIDILSGS